ncbi:uncharacterized protein LOC116193850 [Punica granatum]|uniref:Uncharacterized protein LOC116193850 n=1 Tax=Punica granatum TaxID=22663 RepID=A0A6P8C4M1_PUNGR|nr:uncharacterized protein LOC116193850 [Punica granatum]
MEQMCSMALSEELGFLRPLTVGLFIILVKKPKADTEPNQEKKKVPEAEAVAKDELSVSLLNIRVGLIRKAWKHPSADSLLVEEIDIGETKARQVVSGLAKYCSPDSLTKRETKKTERCSVGRTGEASASQAISLPVPVPDSFFYREDLQSIPLQVDNFILSFILVTDQLSLQSKRKKRKVVALTFCIQMCTIIRGLMGIMLELAALYGPKPSSRSYELKYYRKRDHIRRLVYADDITCTEQLRMDRNAFFKLCHMLQEIGGLKNTRNMHVDEQVAMFLYVLAHHFKNRVIKHQFSRSGEIVSRYFHNVLKATLRLQAHLYKKPQPIAGNSEDQRWKWFKNCLGALDGTYIKIRVPEVDKPRYRTRKGDIATNVLGVCTPDMQFAYVLPG